MKINRSKCELAGIGVKRSVLTALCDVKNVSLVNVSVRVLGVHFSYNITVFVDRNFMDCLKKLQNIIRMWSMRLLTLYGKITIFKTLALSKIINIASLSNIPRDIFALLIQIHKDFIEQGQLGS